MKTPQGTLFWVARRKLVAALWRQHMHRFLDWKGFRNNTIHEDREFLDLFIRVYESGRACMQFREMHNLFHLVRQAADVPGELAEAGVFRGGSARIICGAKGKRELHLFDTFGGMPATEEKDEHFWKGAFSDTTLNYVKDYLAEFDGVHFYPGIFPQSVSGLPAGTRFSFVNIDLDLYQGTLAALEYFYPLVNSRGIIVLHDYRHRRCPGVKRATDEFFAGKPERPILLWDMQCVVVKI